MCSEQTCGNCKHFRAGAVSAPVLRPLRNPPAEKPGGGHQGVRPLAGKGVRHVGGCCDKRRAEMSSGPLTEQMQADYNEEERNAAEFGCKEEFS